MRPTNKRQLPHDRNWITFNVGGSHFSTSRATLIKFTPPNSPLHRVSSNSTNVEWDRDEQGAFMIDRDPIFFQAVLNYLRYGRLILSDSVPEEGVLIEAEYFNIPELAKLIKQRMGQRQRWSRANNTSGLGCGLAAASAAAAAAANQLGPATNLHVAANQQQRQQLADFSSSSVASSSSSSSTPISRQFNQLQQPAPPMNPPGMSVMDFLDCQYLDQEEYLRNYVNTILEKI